MTGRWQGSQRRSQLPPDWAKRRRRVFARDDWTCVDCGHRDPTARTLECDHVAAPDDHRLTSLATRCADCHQRRTQAQAAAGRARRSRRRPPEPHPGLS